VQSAVYMIGTFAFNNPSSFSSYFEPNSLLLLLFKIYNDSEMDSLHISSKNVKDNSLCAAFRIISCYVPICFC
jgi:hypothetical protein